MKILTESFFVPKGSLDVSYVQNKKKAELWILFPLEHRREARARRIIIRSLCNKLGHCVAGGTQLGEPAIGIVVLATLPWRELGSINNKNKNLKRRGCTILPPSLAHLSGPISVELTRFPALFKNNKKRCVLDITTFTYNNN